MAYYIIHRNTTTDRTFQMPDERRGQPFPEKLKGHPVPSSPEKVEFALCLIFDGFLSQKLL